MNNMFGKKKKQAKKTVMKIKERGAYFVFGKYEGSKNDWYFHGEFETKEDAEADMVMHGEPESIVYIVIRGYQLDTEPGIATYPTNIVGEEEK